MYLFMEKHKRNQATGPEEPLFWRIGVCFRVNLLRFKGIPVLLPVKS
jgi:hypothetical protein